MDRDVSPAYFPQCPRNAGLPDQYMWAEKDTTAYKCYNGVSHPIYGCDGKINYSLPLHMYPQQGQVHPQVQRTKRPHMDYRQDPRVLVHEPRLPARPDLVHHYGWMYDPSLEREALVEESKGVFQQGGGCTIM